jgi:hypothetical protein
MGAEIGPILQEHLGTEYEITSIFKFSANLANVLGRSYYCNGRARK